MVSSVLNKDTKQHGKQYLYDNLDDTAWSSNEGQPQWIAIEFEEIQEVNEFSFQFQGGFAPKEATLEIISSANETNKEPFYPEDVNAVQYFKLKETQKDVKRLKFIFQTSTDFFGRLIVYKMQIF